MISLEIDREPEIIYRRSGGGEGGLGLRGLRGGEARLCPEYNLPDPPKRLCYILNPPSPLLAKTDRPSVPP